LQHGQRADSIVRVPGNIVPPAINAIVDESLHLPYHGTRAEKADFNVALQRDLDPSV
jgi:two-component system NtrC family sensor kinase